MISAPSLTVVILTCNSGATIGACLESLVQQEYRDFEVLVVDDDSTDDTLAVVSRYSSSLCLSVTRNGSRSIPRGRNIGLAQSKSAVVAFLDSDDIATPSWTSVIMDTFASRPEVGCISGDLIPGYRTAAAHAIALNDDAVRRLFRSEAAFIAGNCAINRSATPDAMFNEDFRFGEDLELVSRLRKRDQWLHVPEMKVRYYSRETLRQYGSQVYRYGIVKHHFAHLTDSYRWVDYAPLVLLLISVASSLIFRSVLFLSLIVPFSLLETLFVVFYQRCPPRIAIFTFPAWIVKNLCWSYGIGRGIIEVALARDGVGPAGRKNSHGTDH